MLFECVDCLFRLVYAYFCGVGVVGCYFPLFGWWVQVLIVFLLCWDRLVARYLVLNHAACLGLHSVGFDLTGLV